MLGLILQARMGSSRLPGKVMRRLGTRPLLGVIVDRLSRRCCGGHLVIATTILAEDDCIADFCAAEGIGCFRGSQLDVLDRYYRCATDLALDPIVRLTGDNPFIDIEELDRLVAMQAESSAPFAYSFPSLPVGVGAEIFTLVALEISHRKGTDPHHREHVDEYLLENPQLFQTERLEVPSAKRFPEVRLTVDTDADFARALQIVSACGPYATTEQAVAQCLQSA